MDGSARDPDPVDLRVLAEIARRGSIAGASAGLGMSQQAASARVRSLEARLGLTLLVRSRSGSQLTDAGDLVVAWGAEALAAWDRLLVGARTLRETLAPRLRVAASQTVAESMLPTWLMRLRSAEEAEGASPTVVDLVVGNSTTVAEQVRRREVDVGFVETPHVPADLAHDRIDDDEVVIVAAPEHPWLARALPVTLEELAAAGLVVREPGSGTRDTVTAAIAELRPELELTVLLELATTAAVRSAITAGVGAGALSRRLVRDDLVLGRLGIVEVAAPPFRRDITAISPRGDRRSRETRRLLRIAASSSGHPSSSGEGSSHVR